MAPAGAEPGRRRLRLLYALVAATGWTLDLITKVAAVALLTPGLAVPVVGDLLRLRLVRNPGAAFSLGGEATYLFTGLAVAVLVFVAVRLVPAIGHPGWAVGLGLLTAGVAGNLTDRLFRSPGPGRGHVVDFLQLPNWPIFNVADMCITGAAVLIVVLSMVKGVGVDGRRHPPPRRDTGRGTAARSAGDHG